MNRKPLAVTNWKMAMTVAEGLDFIRVFQESVADLPRLVDVVLCPPFTALWPVGRALQDGPIQLGGQNIAASTDEARTGEISATLMFEAGCRWVLLGHWEVRRHLGDDEAIINTKVHLATNAGLAPIVLVGEAHGDQEPLQALADQLARVLEGCRGPQVAEMAFVYEPETAIGAEMPAKPEHVATGCGFIRDWLCRRWGDPVAERTRIIYGGSVNPDKAAELLACPDVDGLGASRRGRDPANFVEILREIARLKAGADTESGV